MPSTFGILSTAYTGLRTNQAALNVTSHNISNATTEGYTRQRASITAGTPIYLAEGAFGTGSAIRDVEQIRDLLLDGNFRRESAAAAEWGTRSDMMGRIETVMGEPSEFALSGTIDRFLSAWSDLATSPSNTNVRSVVRQRGSELAAKFHELAANLDQVRAETESRIADSIGRVNALTDEVAGLNKEIVTVEAGGITAGDLRDSRNRALDALAGLIPVNVIERENGSVGVATSGINIVDGVVSLDLQATHVAGQWGLEVVGRPGQLPDLGGSLGGLMGVLGNDLPAAVQSLDDLAAALVADINALHRTGTNPDGGTGLDFFDPAGTTAWTIGLSVDVQASPRAIAAGTPDGTGAYRAGANDVALQIGALRDTASAALGATPGDHIRGLVSSIGLAVRSSADAAEVHQTLADQADVRRLSLSGVSVDEELIQMIQFQTAYQSAARVITAADEMLQSLLAM